LVDALATRYHLLPSQVLAQADTYDLMVMDVAQSWHTHQQAQAQSESKGNTPLVPNIPVNKLQEMLERVRK
jgi:hypothetical protein